MKPTFRSLDALDVEAARDVRYQRRGDERLQHQVVWRDQPQRLATAQHEVCQRRADVVAAQQLELLVAQATRRVATAGAVGVRVRADRQVGAHALGQLDGHRDDLAVLGVDQLARGGRKAGVGLELFGDGLTENPARSSTGSTLVLPAP